LIGLWLTHTQIIQGAAKNYPAYKISCAKTGDQRVKVKVKADIYLFLGKPNYRTSLHLSYGITQCYLPPGTSERAPPNASHAGWYTHLPTPEGWKAELT